MKEIFDLYRNEIKELQKHFLDTELNDLNSEFSQKYKEYTVLDENYPRPILTLLGTNIYSEDAPKLEHLGDKEIVLIPQMVRDFLAIHDDVIDEDIEKFGKDTLPVSYSKLLSANNENTLIKIGKDFSILYADYLLPIVYKMIADFSINAELKIRISKLISRVVRETNIGQMNELIMQQKLISSCNENEILNMYKQKAANYCYAFPMELGLVYSNVKETEILLMRSIMLEIGAYSQVIDDIMGIFPEFFNNSKNTISDLMLLRRSYILLKYMHYCNDEILKKDKLSFDEAFELKVRIYKSDILKVISEEASNVCVDLKKKINGLKIGSFLKEYLLKLIDSRIIKNLNIIAKNTSIE